VTVFVLDAPKEEASPGKLKVRVTEEVALRKVTVFVAVLILVNAGGSDITDQEDVEPVVVTAKGSVEPAVTVLGRALLMVLVPFDTEIILDAVAPK
jgi:hypothetical protein